MFCSLMMTAAFLKFPAATSRRNAGMSIPTGHPLTQRGFLHWRQRPDSAIASSGVIPVSTSPKSWIRRPTGRSCMVLASATRTEMCLVLFKRFLLFRLVRAQALHKPVEVHFMGIELGTVDTGKFRGTVNNYTAGAAHAGPVHHYRVEADKGPDPCGACHFAGHFHHHCGPDDPDCVDGLSCHHLLQQVGGKAMEPIAAIVRGDEQFIAGFSHLVLEQEQAFVPCADNADDPVARGFECPGNDREACRADTATDKNAGAEFMCLAGFTEWSGNVLDMVSGMECGEVVGGLSDSHEDDAYCVAVHC